MPAFVDLTNEVFGRLIVLSRHPEHTRGGRVQWVCRCNCQEGNVVIVSGSNLRTGNTVSCGCVHKEQTIKAKTKHGLRYTAEYKIWLGIKQRCYNPKNQDYADYGGRGIRVSNEWLEFDTFYRDMGSRPTPEHTIDRENNNLGYCKSNCRWKTRAEQANNKRNVAHYTRNGETRSLPDWCRVLNISHSKTYNRIHCMGWSFEEAIQPIEDMQITFDETTKSLKDWCDLLGLPPAKTALRIMRGETFENLVRE